jgi:hypothetical protein
MSFAEANDDQRGAPSRRGAAGGRGGAGGLSSGFPEDSYGTRGIATGPSTGGGRAIIATDRYDEVATRIEKDIRELTRRLALIQSQVNLVCPCCLCVEIVSRCLLKVLDSWELRKMVMLSATT